MAIAQRCCRTCAAPSVGCFDTALDFADIKPWQPMRFEVVEREQDSPGSHGQVRLMWDIEENRRVAVKRTPNSWIQFSQTELVSLHSQGTELPWQDIICTKYLSSVGFPYGCKLLGVYHDDANSEVVTIYSAEGTCLSWCGSPLNKCVEPGCAREAFIRPIAVNLLLAMRQLHELAIVHNDMCVENILLSESDNGQAQLQIVDFGMASTIRHFYKCLRGKAEYQAPELHESGLCDGFLTDAFSVGVTLYVFCLQHRPWLSTNPEACKSFAYVKKRGFRAYARKRKPRNTDRTVADHMSEDLLRLLEGLLELDPDKRFTLGESVWKKTKRRSVWDEEWLRGFRWFGAW